jgi:dienelactone hydrolase
MTRPIMDRLGSLGYRALAVDLFNGRSATTDADATTLMHMLSPHQIASDLRAAVAFGGGGAGNIVKARQGLSAPPLFVTGSDDSWPMGTLRTCSRVYVTDSCSHFMSAASTWSQRRPKAISSVLRGFLDRRLPVTGR